MGVRGCDCWGYDEWLMGCCVYVAGLGVCVHTHAELGHVWRVGGGTGGSVCKCSKGVCAVWEVGTVS